MPGGKIIKVYSGKRSKPMALASKALKLAKQNRAAIEVKEITNTTTSVITATGSVSNMCNIAEGDDLNGRTGRKIRLKSFQLRGFALNNDLTTSDGSFLRIMVIRDNSFSSSAPAISTILQGAATYSLRAQEVERKYGYSVLYDKFIGLDVNSNNQQVFQKFKKLNHECIFDGSASTSQNKGALYLLLLSNRSTDAPTINMQTRVRFTDA